MTEDWTKEWERRTVNGVYPLQRYLGRSNHSVVFRTECPAQGIAQAAIKILPAHRALSATQLSYWRKAAALTNPHLVRILDSGRCELGGHQFMFVVMEYAEQNLSQILPSRALTTDEVGDLLPPTLDALSYLHAQNLVHGGLKPTNFMVVDDRLKLASDTIQPAGERQATIAKLTVYDAPEAKSGPISLSRDMWALGVTLIEALTQTPPAWSRETSDAVVLPAGLSPQLASILQRCLDREPKRRPLIAELSSLFAQDGVVASPPAQDVAPVATRVPTAPIARAVIREPSAASQPFPAEQLSDESPTSSSGSSEPSAPKGLSMMTVVGLVVVALAAIWAGKHWFHGRPSVAQAPVIALPVPKLLAAPAPVETSKPSVAVQPTIVHEEVPEVSKRSRESIRGVIKVTVRATVNRSGDVVATHVETHGSSKYFARAATEAAKKWKFVPAPDRVSRTWLLQFEFSREGVTADGDAA
jgi:TonB family protein